MTATERDRLARLTSAVSTHLGLHFPESRRGDLVSGVERAVAELGLDRDEALTWLEKTELSAREVEVLASHLTIGETYFFRDRPVFDALRDEVLPALIAARRATDRRLRIWSAGCCTGEEAYSVAILVESLIPDLSSWNVSILASDVNRAFLRKAEAGVYGAWSFRNGEAELQRRYFTEPSRRSYEVVPRIRERVRFAYLNLARDAFPSPLNDTCEMDLILCRNVLMYFGAETALEIMRRFARSLRADGWLALSPTDPQRGLSASFRAVHHDGAVFYRPSHAAAASLSVVSPPATRQASVREGGPNRVERRARVHAQARSSRVELLRSAEPVSGDGRLLAEARRAANAGELERALGLCEGALGVEKLDPVTYHLKASVLSELGRSAEAVAALNQALYLDPGFVLAHFALGHHAAGREDAKRARKHLEAVLALLSPRSADEVLPESDGLTTGRLIELSRALLRELGRSA